MVASEGTASLIYIIQFQLASTIDNFSAFILCSFHCDSNGYVAEYDLDNLSPLNYAYKKFPFVIRLSTKVTVFSFSVFSRCWMHCKSDSIRPPCLQSRLIRCLRFQLWLLNCNAPLHSSKGHRCSLRILELPQSMLLKDVHSVHSLCVLKWSTLQIWTNGLPLWLRHLKMTVTPFVALAPLKTRHLFWRYRKLRQE